MHDLVIRGGSVVDGSLPRQADIAVDNGVITAVGDVAGVTARTIDATGLLVTPGFVDVHTHYDAQASWDPYLTPSSWHGALVPGLRADINVIDYDTLNFGKPRMVWDLPGGAPRLVQKAHGYRHTLVKGIETVIDDQFAGDLPGRLVRGPR